jgi:EpsI family protein
MPTRLAYRRFVLVGFLLTVTLVVSMVADQRRPEPLVMPLDTIANRIGGWTAVGTQALTPRLFDKLLPSSYIARIYQKQHRQLALFIAFYAEQRAGETMHSPKACLPGNGWEISQRDTVVASLGGRPVKLNRFHVRNEGQRMLVLYWYQSRQRIIASEYMCKVLLVKDALLTGHTSGSIVRIMLPDGAGAPAAAASFAKLLIPQVQRCFGG